jgi:hypothetical protein
MLRYPNRGGGYINNVKGPSRAKGLCICLEGTDKSAAIPESARSARVLTLHAADADHAKAETPDRGRDDHRCPANESLLCCEYERIAGFVG